MQESLDTSLVRIRATDGTIVGAGFLVGERHVLTCAYIITQALGLARDPVDRPSAMILIDFPLIPPRTLLTAKVVLWQPPLPSGSGDIAGLELKGDPPDTAKMVRPAFAEDVWDHPFRAFGFPPGQDDGVWATGRLLGRQGTDWLMIEDVKAQGFAVAPGFSGTPVWDTQIQGIVGMVVAASRPADTKTAFVIPTDVLATAWPVIVTPPREPRNPFKGLRAFTEHDARDFFGRDALIDELATAVETALSGKQQEGQHARLLAVLGASGSGKSSVVKAGLLPCLRDGRVLNSKEWVYLDPIFPGAHPLEALAVSLAKQLPARGPVSLHKDLATGSARSLHMLTCQLMESSQQKVVLIVDQFEEVFTLTTDEDERRHFFELLVTAVTEPDGPLFVILTLRADFYDRPMHYPELFRLIDDHHVSVLPLERDDLRSVIERPANLPEVQLTFEKGLVDELLFDMQGQSGALPLLEFTLDQLFQQRSGHKLTLQAYREMGGIKGALSQHAEETYQKLTPEQQKAARDIFLRLIEPGTTEQDATRHRAARSEFESADPIQEQQMQETLEAFFKARLLTTNQIGSNTTVEVSHEALIGEWKSLSNWLYEARGDILIQRSLSEEVEEWEQEKRPRDRLYRGTQLKKAQEWARRNRPSEQEAAFLQASTAQRTLSIVSLIAVVLLLISSLGIAGWYVFFQPSKTLVTTLQDTGVGSLRWCIDNAPSSSTISFAQGIRGILELTGGNLEFPGGKQLTIAGPGANQLTISGPNRDANIHVSKGAMVTISGLSFKNSKTLIYAFLFNQGTLTVTNSVISDNTTGAGATSYGGGIFNAGTLSVINSTISNNSSIGDDKGQGGGIYNEGKLTVTGSTFSNNKASSSSGTGFGGGIDNNSTGTIMVTTSTFSGNSATGKQGSFGGGILSAGLKNPSAIIRFCTIYGNTSSQGGGIWVDPTGSSQMTISSSIVAANSAPDGPDIYGALISDGHNLIENVAGATGLNATTDKQVTLTELGISPTLGNNGGPTQTLALLQGSQAIDVPQQACSVTVTDVSGQNVTITTDQRGHPRPDGSENVCDIGAYESSY